MIFYVFITVVCSILGIFLIYSLYEIWETKSIRKMVSESLFELMEVHYIGPFKKIRRNLDMFSTYAFYVEKLIPDDKKDCEVEIIFELKDKNIDKKKLCYKFLSISQKKEKVKIDKFMDNYYNIFVKIK